MIRDLRAQRDALAEALRHLVDHLDEVSDHQDYRAVWAFAQLHLGAYQGPNYAEQLMAARAALAKVTP